MVVVVATTLGLGATAASAKPAQVAKLDPEETDLEVFMDVEATDRQIDAVERAIRSSEAVRRYAFLDTDEAYQEFKRIFRDNPELVHSIRPSDLPASFRIDTRSKSAAQKLARRTRRMPGVESAAPRDDPLSEAEVLTTIRDCQLRADSTFEIFMDVGASETQVEAVRRLVEAQPGFTVIRVLSQEDAYAEFAQIFASQPDLVQKVSADDLPMSIRVHADEQPSRTVVNALESAPGVDSIETPSEVCIEILRTLGRGLTPEQLAKLMVEQVYGTAA